MTPPLTDYQGLTADAVVARAVAAYGRRLALSCSFGGAGGMVLLDLAWRADPHVHVFVLDTDFLFDETYALLERVESRYGLKVHRVRPDLTPEAQAKRFGEALWTRDPDACCEIRKVAPMRRALAGFDAWMTAVRRDQSSTRRDTPVAEFDAKLGVVKICPLADWTGRDVWEYVKQHDLPVNPLLTRGYRSIGCVQCTSNPDAPSTDDERAGRWAGFAKTECGLHRRPPRP